MTMVSRAMVALATAADEWWHAVAVSRVMVMLAAAAAAEALRQRSGFGSVLATAIQPRDPKLHRHRRPRSIIVSFLWV
jgi:hypothetical protein